MKLISCNGCGAVLDKDKLHFPIEIYGEDDCIDETAAAWDGDTYVPFTKCPVCDERILESQG